MHGDRRIEDHLERDQARMNVGLLQPETRLGDAGARVEFATAQGGRYANLPHLRRTVCGKAPFARDWVDDSAKGLEPIRFADIVLEAKGDDLAAVGRRAAADAQQEVAARFARLVGTGDHRVARTV